MILRVVIADDEPLAREGLRHLLSHQRDIEVMAESRNGREAVEVLRAGNVDLVFLDVQMPGMDGFSVIEEVGAAQMTTQGVQKRGAVDLERKMHRSIGVDSVAAIPAYLGRFLRARCS